MRGGRAFGTSNKGDDQKDASLEDDDERECRALASSTRSPRLRRAAPPVSRHIIARLEKVRVLAQPGERERPVVERCAKSLQCPGDTRHLASSAVVVRRDLQPLSTLPHAARDQDMCARNVFYLFARSKDLCTLPSLSHGLRAFRTRRSAFSGSSSRFPRSQRAVLAFSGSSSRFRGLASAAVVEVAEDPCKVLRAAAPRTRQVHIRRVCVAETCMFAARHPSPLCCASRQSDPPHGERLSGGGDGPAALTLTGAPPSEVGFFEGSGLEGG